MQSTPNVTAVHVLGVAAVFSMVSICARIAYDAGSNALTVITLRIVLLVPVLWLFLKARRASWRLPSSDRNRALALGALLALSTLALNKALEIIPVAIAILIHYTYPPAHQHCQLGNRGGTVLGARRDRADARIFGHRAHAACEG